MITKFNLYKEKYNDNNLNELIIKYYNDDSEAIIEIIDSFEKISDVENILEKISFLIESLGDVEKIKGYYYIDMKDDSKPTFFFNIKKKQFTLSPLNKMSINESNDFVVSELQKRFTKIEKDLEDYEYDFDEYEMEYGRIEFLVYHHQYSSTMESYTIRISFDDNYFVNLIFEMNDPETTYVVYQQKLSEYDEFELIKQTEYFLNRISSKGFTEYKRNMEKLNIDIDIQDIKNHNQKIENFEKKCFKKLDNKFERTVSTKIWWYDVKDVSFKIQYQYITNRFFMIPTNITSRYVDNDFDEFFNSIEDVAKKYVMNKNVKKFKI